MAKRRDVSASAPTKRSSISEPRKSTTREIANPGAAFAPDLSLGIAYMSVSELTEYDKNPRTHSSDQIQQIAESIKAFGFVSPLIVDLERQLIAGHGRLVAAKLLGLNRVPVVSIDHLNDGQKKALRIADNRLAELAGWDEDLLALEFSSLVDMDSDSDLNFELEITGFSFGAIDQLIDVAKKDNSSDSDDCFESEFTVPTVSQLGDLWLLEEHTLPIRFTQTPTNASVFL
jgi:hypothetical protein